ncbi:MAG: hypothetical protein JWO30_467 [Fibrobacteres bacterium]|nr:hypothetical protein [Fibrobacterota bacterium]
MGIGRLGMVLAFREDAATKGFPKIGDPDTKAQCQPQADGDPMFSFHAKLAFRTGVALACALGTGRAALDFDTYRIIQDRIKITRSGVTTDSIRTTYELTRLGSTSLEASSITLTSHGGYLSVTEEATLTGNVENRPHDITQDFLLQGSLPIPPLAAVRSLSAIHGDTLFHAKLRKMTYSLNDSFLDTVSMQATLDNRVAFLQQLTDVGFEATFSKLSLGEPVRVRIEYDIPFPGAPGASLRIPVLFHPSGTPPRQAQITFFEKAEGLPAVQWLSDNGRVTLNDAETHTVQYQSEFLFRRDESPKTVASMQATTFESGAFKGNYLLFKGGLNDSLMNILSRPLEVAFLWRWNPPYNFVEIRDGLKTLSASGQMAALEARTLKQIILEFAPRGHRFGLLRSAPGSADDYFAPAEAGSEGYGKLLAYLDQFTEQRLYADYKDYKDGTLPWAATAWTDSGEIVKSQKEFLAVLARIRGGFSDRPEALRHIEMIGLGSSPSTLIDLKDPKQLEAAIDSTTLSNVLASWPGVDLGQALQLKANATLRPLDVNSPLAAGLPPLLFPVFQPTSVEYRAFTPARSHAVVLPFSLSAQREAMIKAESPFGDTVQLQGIDALGRKTRIFTLTPRMLRAQADSSMARLWAADPDRISEASEVDIGMRYGILTKGSYWGAGIGDATLYQGGTVPPGTPILPKLVHAGSGQSFRVENGFLRLDAAAMGRDLYGKAPRLEIYDLRGRMVASFSLADFRSANGFAIPIEFLRRLGHSGLVLILRGAGRVQPFSLTFGGML